MKYSTLIINLDWNPERLAYMKKQFDNFGMSFERLQAVNGNEYDFSKEFDEELFRKKNGGNLISKGYLGCTLSHKRALQAIIDRNDDYGLILEDDVELNPNFKNIIETELRKRESGETSWEYLSFNYPSVGWKSIHLWLFTFSNIFNKNKKDIKFYFKLPIYLIKFLGVSVIYLFEGLRENIFKALKIGKPSYFFRSLYLAGCYLVTKEAAEKLVKLNTPIIYSSDGLPNVARLKIGLKFYGYVPLIARQKREEFNSMLDDTHFGKKVISY